MLRAIVSLMTLQGINYLLSFGTLAILARFLSGADLTAFLYVQAAAAFLAILVDYGLFLPGMRSMTEAQLDRRERIIVTEVHATRLCLLGLAAVLGALVLLHNRVIGFSLELYLALCLAIFTYGFKPLWYFQAVGQYRHVVVADLAAGIAALLFILLAMNWQAGVAYALLAWASPRAAATLYLVGLIHVRHGMLRIRVSSVIAALRRSFLFFLHKVAAGFVHLATPVLLGYLVTQPHLLAFQASERLVTASQSLLAVVSQVSYARILKLFKFPQARARAAHRATAWQLGAACIVSVIVDILAPKLLLFFWAISSGEATHTLRLLAWILPILALNSALGLNYLLPARKDHLFVLAAIVGGFVSVGLIIVAAPFLQETGGVLGIAVGESAMTIIMLTGGWSSIRRNPQG